MFFGEEGLKGGSMFSVWDQPRSHWRLLFHPLRVGFAAMIPGAGSAHPTTI